MKKRLSHIMLIDDDEAVTFIHRLLIQKQHPDVKISTAWNGEDALRQLEALHDQGAFPELILLDLNMPLLNGWEFLKAFEQRWPDVGPYPVVWIVTASMNPDDQARANDIARVRAFVTKPLYTSQLSGLTSEYFAS